MKKTMKTMLAALMVLALMIGAAVPTLAESMLDTESMFTDRDLNNEPDLSDAVYYTLSDGEDIHITEAGIYVLNGSADNVTVYVEAGDEDKVQIVLSSVTIINEDMPAIWVKTADKVFVTVAADSTLKVTGSFQTVDGTKLDGVIFSKQDLTLNGTAQLTISSTKHGIVCKDDLKITGAAMVITASGKTIEANDSIRISDGTLTLTAGTDALHTGNDDLTSYIYISGGTITIQAGDDGIHADAIIQIDGGTLDITGAEGIEATYIQINGGTISIKASDDGINAARKSSDYTPTVEINDGDITIAMGAGDTDGVDSNGNIIINGGTISVTGNSTFDYDGTGVINGGTVIVNGQQVSTLPNQMMGGGGGWGNQGGGWGNPGGGWGNPGGGMGNPGGGGRGH